MATPDWVNYDEKVVGENHGSLSDVANRPGKTLHANMLAEHDVDGKHKLSGFQGAQYAADAGASDTYVITLAPVPAALFDGMIVSFKANTINTGAATLNVNALGAKTIKKNHDQDLATGDIESGQKVLVQYDGTNFQMLSQTAIAEGYMLQQSVADEAEIALSTARTGWGWAMAGDNEEIINFRFTAAGVVTIISNSANAINTDTDGFLCVYDAGAGIAIKNRLGATKVIRYIVNYS